MNTYKSTSKTAAFTTWIDARYVPLVCGLLASMLLSACGGDNAAQSSASPSPTFTVGGTLSGLGTGGSLVLRNNGGNDLALAANGSFTFTTALAAGSAYAVNVHTQPSGQTCAVTSGAGTVTANVTAVTVNCTVNSDLVAPTPPSSLVATTRSSTQIDLTWTASTDNVGVTGYQLERCAGSACANFAALATSAATTYSDTGGAPSTTYRYRVRAVDATGNLSTYSAAASATTSPTTSACAQTLSPGANIAAAVAAAAAGSTLCLTAGDYGTVNLWNISRTTFVTLTSVGSPRAQLSPSIGRASFIRLDNLTLSDALINNGSANIQIVNSAFIPNRGGLAIVDSRDVLVDKVDFTDVNQATWSGRLSLNNATHTTVSNSTFAGVGRDTVNVQRGAADGIMVIGNAANNTIGPNNVFSGIRQGLCDVANPGSHCDSIQIFGAGRGNVITGNYFVNGDTFIMAPDGSDEVTVTHNVFSGDSVAYPWKLQFGSANGVRFEHNTLTNTGVAFDSKPGNPASSNILARNNIVKGIGFKTDGGNGCAPNCVFEYNLFGTSGIARGSANLIGNPTFVGGAAPATYADHRLSPGSLGVGAASNGQDMGVVFTALAAAWYVRSGATGNGSGTDWTHAYTTLPPTLVRGGTYYIADGTYAGYTFDDAVSGSLVTTIKKATVADHGTATGWENTFGDGQAVFTGTLTFRTHNWLLDGQTRNESDWFAAGAYGFAVSNNGDRQIVIQNYGVGPSNITVKHVFLDAIVGNLPGTTIRRYAVDVDDFDGGATSTGLVFHRMYVRGSNNVWFLRTTDGAIVEYSASDGAASNSANHGEIVNAYFSVFNATIRYNIFRNAFIGNGGTALIAIAAGRNQARKPQLDIYGNVFHDYEVGDGAIGFLGNQANGGNCTNCRVFNNTFANANVSSAVQFPDGSGNVVSNNIFMNLGSGAPGCNLGSAATVSANAVGPGSSAGSCGGTNAQVSLPTSIFVNYAGKDFRLNAATGPGAPLASPFNVDLLGRPRGADGVWDRGAFEHP